MRNPMTVCLAGLVLTGCMLTAAESSLITLAGSIPLSQGWTLEKVLALSHEEALAL